MVRVLGRPVLLLALFTAAWSPALPDEREESGEARFSFALIGDSHYYKTDKPALNDAGHLIENFNRVESFGDANVHWVKITVDPDSRGVFQVEPVVIVENAFPH